MTNQLITHQLLIDVIDHGLVMSGYLGAGLIDISVPKCGAHWRVALIQYVLCSDQI